MNENIFGIPIEIWQMILVFLSLHLLVIGGILIGLILGILTWRK